MIHILTSVVLAAFLGFAQAPAAGGWQAVAGGDELSGQARFTIGGTSTAKRFVLRMPAKWNGSLVIGAHGGSGGNAVDRSGKVYATSETALDDVIGAYVFAHGFAYASVDRDGIGGSEEGALLTVAFLAKVDGEILKRFNLMPERRYVVGLSAGGGMTRRIAEDTPAGAVDGVVIIAGAGGDLVTRMDRQQRIAALWPLIDPRAHAGLTSNDPQIASYADAIGTPVEARRLWPYTGAGAATASRPTGTVENSTAKPSIPVIEVVGTWDDLVIREVRAYRDRVEPKERHRLYQVEGVWHMSGDDDGVAGFQYAAESRMKLDQDVADAMGEGPSYIPTVHDAFDALVRWVEKGVAPPSSQTVKPGGKLR
ncbi:MAG: alpha/beta hydrolase domain-containing protein [Vicinamibacterales bacterium]